MINLDEVGGKMLFDERDLRVFDNSDSVNYFKEIVQSYYNQNYRATIVLLYSFVIYDLFIKLQDMANEGDNKAQSKLAEINTLIKNDERYSRIENEIIQFFKDNCNLYFGKFIEDIEYLKKCRNKCAHLKVDDNTLYVPSDYHARMLICSMYDNVFSVKAPFIMDLFKIAEKDVERYNKKIFYISYTDFDESIKTEITNKYLSRMTYESMKKSYKTFIKLLLVSDEQQCIENLYGLYAFTYVMTDYILRNGYSSLFYEESISNMFLKIKVQSLEDSSDRRNALFMLMQKYPRVLSSVRYNKEVFEYMRNLVLSNALALRFYRLFNPDEKETIYGYFKNNNSSYSPVYIEEIYGVVKECNDFEFSEYIKLMVCNIPNYNGFSAADCFMDFFINKLPKLSIEDINYVMEEYSKNSQCTNRYRNSEDITAVKDYISQHTKK